jgi:pimeloyl-ACP methyl ester carboxylesterase
MILNHKIIGEGEPLIILHGLFGMLDNWQRFAKQISERYQVILVDQRNHGKSFRSEEFNYDLLANDIIRLMDHLSIEQAHILGHSMGGKTTMEIATKFPQRVDSFIVVDIAPKIYKGDHQFIFDSVLSIDVDAAETRKEIDEHLAKSIKEMGVRLFLMKNLKRKKEGGFEWKANFPILKNCYVNIMGNSLEKTSDAKGIFIKGSLSSYILTNDESAIKKYFPNSTIAEVEGAGHWVHADKPQELFNLVADFLD